MAGYQAMNYRRLLRHSVSIVVASSIVAFQPLAPAAQAESVIRTVAGTGVQGFAGDGLAATSARLSNPVSVAPEPGGGFLIADSGNGRIRRVSASGVITTVLASPEVVAPSDVVSTGDGGFLFADDGSRLVKQVSSTGAVTTVAGGGSSPVFAEGADATSVRLTQVNAIDLLPGGGFLIADRGGCCSPSVPPRILKVDGDGDMTTAAGGAGQGFGGDGGPATSALLGDAFDVEALSATSFLIADTGNNRVRKVSGGIITTDAGPTISTTGELLDPRALEAAPDGSYFVNSYERYRIFRVSSSGQMSVVAGNGQYGFSCDGGLATSASVQAAGHIALDGDDLLISDTYNNRIRQVGEGPMTVPPSASLTVSANPALTDDEVVFDSAGSTDKCSPIVRREWDLDGDGVFELDSGTTAQVSRSYDDRGDRLVRLRVTNSGGLESQATVNLAVRAASPPGPIGVSINGGDQYTNDPKVTVSARWPRFATDFVISNDGGFEPFSQGPLDNKIAWRLDSSGPERLPKTIYVRFLGGEAGPETYQDDIILDETAPNVESVSVVDAAGGGTPKAGSSGKTGPTFKLRIQAKDKTSGVEEMQVTARKSKPGKWKRFKGRTTLRSSSGKAFVRVRDGAGNRSKWKRAST